MTVLAFIITYSQPKIRSVGQPRRILLRAVMLMCLVVGQFLTGGEAGDRAQDWRLGEAGVPEFIPTERIPAEIYQRRKADILRGLDRAQLATTADVLFSYGISQVDPDTVASAQGIVAGDEILRVGQHPCDPLMPYALKAFRGEGVQEILLERSQGRLITHSVKPGRWGIGLAEVNPRLAAIYLADESQAGPWDDDMLVACVAAYRDGELAESALAQGKAAGYHGAIGHAIAAAIAHQRFQHEAAVADRKSVV